MDVSLSADAAAVVARVGPWLGRRRVEANLPASIVHRAAAGGQVRPLLLAVVADEATADPDDDGVVGLAVHGEGYPVVVGPMPDAAAALLAQRLLDEGVAFDAVTGPPDACAAFARAVTARTGRTASVAMREGVLVLADLDRPRGVPGSARPAGEDDVDVVHAWMAAFVAEAVPDDPVPARAAIAVRVRAGGWLLWEDGGRATSMAHLHGAVAGVARIGPVYTPPEHRRCGYAAALTAAGCCRLLADGADDVILFTDLANPTSNGVYERIGFRRRGEAVLLRLR